MSSRPFHFSSLPARSPSQLQFSLDSANQQLYNFTLSPAPNAFPAGQQSSSSTSSTTFYSTLQLFVDVLRLYPMPLLIGTAIFSNALILVVMLGAREYRLHSRRAARTIAFRYYCVFFATGDLICIVQFIYDQLHLRGLASALAGTDAACKAVWASFYFGETLTQWLLVSLNVDRFLLLYFPLAVHARSPNMRWLGVRFVGVIVLSVAFLFLPALCFRIHSASDATVSEHSVKSDNVRTRTPEFGPLFANSHAISNIEQYTHESREWVSPSAQIKLSLGLEGSIAHSNGSFFEIKRSENNDSVSEENSRRWVCSAVGARPVSSLLLTLLPLSNIFVYPTIINAVLTGLIVHKLVQRVRTHRRLRIGNGIAATIGAVAAVGAAVGRKSESAADTVVGPDGEVTALKKRKSCVTISAEPSVERTTTSTDISNHLNENTFNKSRNDVRLPATRTLSSPEIPRIHSNPNQVSFPDIRVVDIGSFDDAMIAKKNDTTGSIEGDITGSTGNRNQHIRGGVQDETASACNCANNSAAISDDDDTAVISSLAQDGEVCAALLSGPKIRGPSSTSTPTSASASPYPAPALLKAQNPKSEPETADTKSPSPKPNLLHRRSILRHLEGEYRTSSEHLVTQSRAVIVTSEHRDNEAEESSIQTINNNQNNIRGRRNGGRHSIESRDLKDQNRRNSLSVAQNGGLADQSSGSNGDAAAKKNRESSPADSLQLRRGSRSNSWYGAIAHSASVRRMSRASFKRSSDPCVRITSHSRAEYSMTVTIVVLSVVQTGIFAGIGAVWPLLYLNNAFDFLSTETKSHLLIWGHFFDAIAIVVRIYNAFVYYTRIRAFRAAINRLLTCGLLARFGWHGAGGECDRSYRDRDLDGEGTDGTFSRRTSRNADVLQLRNMYMNDTFE